MKTWWVLAVGIIILAAGCCALAASPDVSTLLPDALQAELAPYVTASTQMGTPLVRSLSADFPKDPKAAAITDEYMVGPALMVAPVAEGSTREIYLPLARWYNYWTNEVTGGGVAHVTGSEGRAPIFVRGSSIVPTAMDGGGVDFRVYSGYPAEAIKLCSNDNKCCRIKASRIPDGMLIAVTPTGGCPAGSMISVYLPYRRVARATLNGRTLSQLAADQFSGASQGWMHDGTVVRIKSPMTGPVTIRLAYYAI